MKTLLISSFEILFELKSVLFNRQNIDYRSDHLLIERFEKIQKVLLLTMGVLRKKIKDIRSPLDCRERFDKAEHTSPPISSRNNLYSFR